MFIPKRVIFEKGSLDTKVGKNIYNTMIVHFCLNNFTVEYQNRSLCYF